MSIPGWWLGLSALFFVVSIVAFGAVLVLCMRLIKEISVMSVQINELTQQVKETSVKVNELVVSLHRTVNTVGGNAQSVSNVLESVVSSGAKRFEKYSGLISVLFTGFRLFQAMRQAAPNKTKKS